VNAQFLLVTAARKIPEVFSEVVNRREPSSDDGMDSHHTDLYEGLLFTSATTSRGGGGGVKISL